MSALFVCSLFFSPPTEKRKRDQCLVPFTSPNSRSQVIFFSTFKTFITT